jgi:hypothetical protein
VVSPTESRATPDAVDSVPVASATTGGPHEPPDRAHRPAAPRPLVRLASR